MTYQFSVYSLIYLASTCLSLVSALITWNRRMVRGGFWLFCVACAGVIFSLCTALDVSAVPETLKIFWGKCSYFGSSSITIFLLLFALEYTNHSQWITRRRIALLFVIPAFSLIAAFTNDWHYLLWTHFTLAPDVPNLLVYHHGPLYWVIMLYLHATVAVASFLLIRFALRSREIYRYQSILVIIATLIPWAFQIIYDFIPGFLPGLDPSGIGIAIGAALFTLNMLRWKLLDIIPVAREALLENLQDGVIVLNSANQIVDLNLAARNLLGETNRSLIGQPVQSLFFAPFIDFSALQVSETPIEMPLNLKTPRTIEFRVSNLWQTPDQVEGRLVVLRDITQRKQMEKELLEREVLFRRLFENNPNAIILTDVASMCVLDCNQIACEMNGYTHAELIGQPLSLLFTADTNRILMDPLARKELIDILSQQADHTHENIHRRKDGSLLLVESSMCVLTIHGQTILMSIDRDISERKLLEQALVASKAMYLGIVEDQTDPVCRWLPDTRLTFVNEAFCEYFGKTREELVGQPLKALLPPETQAGLERTIERLLQREISTANNEEMNYDAAGNIRWAIWAYRPIEHENKEIIEFQSVGRDITDRIRAEEALRQANEEMSAQLSEIQALQVQLREHAVRDVLTGLFNRRYMQETLDREISRAARGDYPLSLVMIDIDYFKKVNDSYGHKAGDLVLQAMGKLLLAHTRQMDVACRFGGEEFLLILPTAPLEIAQQRAEYLRQRISNLAVDFADEILHITVSVGVATYPAHGSDSDTLLYASDNALYLAKQAGRNTIQTAIPLPKNS